MSNEFNGLLLIDKPIGLTSFSVVSRLRRITGIKKIGHTGTLDPFASGLLPILFGRYTRLAQYIENNQKTYEVEIMIGKATDTLDCDGEVVAIDDFQKLNERIETGELESQLQKILHAEFIGEIKQIPPMFSAVKMNGKPLYKYAREGVELERKPRQVTIYDASLSSIYQIEGEYRMKATIECSKGTYIRTWVNDLMIKANTYGHAVNLRRTMNGNLSIKDKAVSLDKLLEMFSEINNQEKMREIINQQYFTPIENALSDLFSYSLTEKEYEKVIHGQKLKLKDEKIINSATHETVALDHAKTMMITLIYIDRIVAVVQYTTKSNSFAQYQCVLADSHIK